jgi:hypothetical protein
MQRLRRPVFLLIVGTTGALRQWQGDGVPARRPRVVHLKVCKVVVSLRLSASIVILIVSGLF